MALEFEEILPYVEGEGDTGKTAREKINRNFTKIEPLANVGAEMQQLRQDVSDDLEQLHDDVEEMVDKTTSLFGYYNCSTAGATAAKSVQATGYELTTGGNIRIKMEHANTAASPVTLQIGNATAKELFYNGEAVSDENTWEDNEVIVVYFDGTKYIATNSLGGSKELSERVRLTDKATKALRRIEINLQTAGDYEDGYLINRNNELVPNNGKVACRNIPISPDWDSCIITGNTNASYGHCIIDANSNVIAFIGSGRNKTISFVDYPDGKYLSICSTDGDLRLYVNYYDDSIQQKLFLNQQEYFANKLSEVIYFEPVFETGSFYSQYGDIRSNQGALYTPDFALIPSNATKIYYSGKSYGTAKGAVIWYDQHQQYIGYSSPNINEEVSDYELDIPQGAVYYKASSYSDKCKIKFSSDKKTINGIISQIQEQNDLIRRTSKLLNDVVNGNFETYTDSVTFPEGVNTSSEGTQGTSRWGMILSNDGEIAVSNIRLYTRVSATSFELYVGTVDIVNLTYTIDKRYIIDESLSIGENSIDVSDYNIVIPPRSYVSCTAVLDYTNGTTVGAVGAVRVGSLAEGASGTLVSTTVANYVFAFALEGTISGYRVISGGGQETSLKSNILYGKKYVAIGDSFTADIGANNGAEEIEEDGPYKGYNKVYPYIIGNRNNMVVTNQGAGGSTLTQYIMAKKYNNIPADVDYITIWYGINDGLHMDGNGEPVRIGTVDNSDDNIPDIPNIADQFEASTCDAFNWMFNWILANRPYAHVGVIISDFMDSLLRREAIIACCEKWGIAYLDLYDPTIPMIRTRGSRNSTMTQYPHNTQVVPAGYIRVSTIAMNLREQYFSRNPSNHDMHPSPTCHEWQSGIIEHFMRGL